MDRSLRGIATVDQEAGKTFARDRVRGKQLDDPAKLRRRLVQSACVDKDAGAQHPRRHLILRAWLGSNEGGQLAYSLIRPSRRRQLASQR